MLFVIDGPEAAGKTSLVDVLAEVVRLYGWHVVHCRCRRPPILDLDAYVAMLKMAERTDTLVIMDRGWAAEAVYSRLLRRSTERDATWLEWHLGRAVPGLGCGIMLLDHPADIASRRRKNDLPVQVTEEVAAFRVYAENFGWTILQSPSTDSEREHVADQIVNHLVDIRYELLQGRTPQRVCGAPMAPIVVVGTRSAPEKRGRRKGTWLPLSSWTTEWLMDVVPTPFGSIAWTNVTGLDDERQAREEVLHAAVVVTLGNAAARWVDFFGANGQVVSLPHPTAVTRWAKVKAMWPAERYAETFQRAVASAGDKRGLHLSINDL